MKRQWEVRRQVQPVMDGARRWDRAYMLILGWSSPSSRPALPEADAPSPPAQEVSHEDGDVCARLDGAGQAQAQTIEQQPPHYQPELALTAAERVDELISLPDQQVTGAEDRCGRLALLAFTATKRMVDR